MGRSRSTPGLVESKLDGNQGPSSGDKVDPRASEKCCTRQADEASRSESTCQATSTGHVAPNVSLTRASPVSEVCLSGTRLTERTKHLSNVPNDHRHLMESFASSSSSKHQTGSDYLEVFKASMSSALSAPHLASNQSLFTSTGATYGNASTASGAGGGGVGVNVGDTKSSSVMSSTPVPGEMSQELLIAEIKRLRDQLHLLEYENAAMTCRLSQQSWEVNNRLTEIECQIGATSTSNVTNIGVSQGHPLRDPSRQSGETSQATRDTEEKAEYRRYLNHHLGQTTTGVTSSPGSPITASSSDSITLDESEKNRESVI